MRKSTAVLLLLLSALNVLAVKISGRAKGFEGEFIRLYRVADFISFREEKLDVWKVDANGNFTFTPYLHGDELIRIKIRDISQSFIAPSGTDLDIELNYDEELNRNRIYDRQFQLHFVNSCDKGINEFIWDFQKSFAGFVARNQRLFATKQARPAVQQFKDSVNASYKQKLPLYFANYLEYSLASLEDAVMASETMLYEKYIKGRPIAYHNLAYMNFFVQFYQERFVQLSQGKNGFQVLSAVNGSGDLAKLKELVRGSKLIEGDSLIELFIINGLREVYSDETFKKDKVLRMLSTLVEKTICPDNASIAKNILEDLTFLKPGKSAPNFNLNDAEGLVHHLSDQEKRPVLLYFWSTSSLSSVRQLSLLKDLYANYGRRLVFISICMDDKTKKAGEIMKEAGADWLNLFADAQYDLVDKYDMHLVPTYSLIDSKGKIFRHPAGIPQTTLEGEIEKMLSENGGQHIDH